MKRALSLLAALAIIFTASNTFAQEFSNINSYDDELNEARERGIVFDESTLEQQVTRAKMVEFVVPFAFTQSEIDACDPNAENWPFSDVDQNSALAKPLCVANKNGVIDTNDQFYPDRNTNLPELTKVMSTAFKFPVAKGVYDVWYDGHVITMMTAGVVLPSEVYSETGPTIVTNKLAIAYMARMQNYLDSPDELSSVEHIDNDLVSQKKTCSANQLLHQSDLSLQSYELIQGNYYKGVGGLYYMEPKTVSAADAYSFAECFEPFALMNSDPNDFEILYGNATHLHGTYIKSGNNIYIDGLKIEGADAASFEPFDYSLSRDTNNIYYKNQIQGNVDPASFEPVAYHVYKDKNTVYINYGGLKTLDEADAASFVYLGGDGYYAKDANNVYNLSPTWPLVLGADAGSFNLWGRWHGSDNSQIFYRRGSISGIDYATAEFVGGYYIKDKDTVYCGATPMEADATTFEYVGDNIAKDATTTYDNCQPVRDNDTLEEIYSRYFDFEIGSSGSSLAQFNLSPRCATSKVFPQIPIVDDPIVSNRSRYDIGAKLDYTNQTLDVSQSIRYVNHTDAYLTDLLLNIEHNREPGIFCLGKLNWSDGTPVDPSIYTYDGPNLRLTLPQPLAPNGNVELEASFSWNIPDGHWSFGTVSTQQLRFVDWFLYAPAYDEELGWLTSDPSVDENNAYNYDDFHVKLEVTDPSVVIGATTLPKKEGNIYEYKHTGRTFAFLASPDYQILQHHLGGNLTFTNYVFSGYEAEAEAIVPYLEEAVDLYTELYGPINKTSMSAMQVGFVDSMEYPGYFVQGTAFYDGFDGGRKNFLTAIGVHEVAHQWWYEKVGNDQYREPFLDEMFALYSEMLYYENQSPEMLAWWNDFRKDRRNANVTAIGPVNSPMEDFSSFGAYVSAVYDRGVNFLNEVREVLGDDLFFEMLRELSEDNAQKQLTSEIFFETIEKYYNLRPAGASVSGMDYLSRWQEELLEIEAAFEEHAHGHFVGTDLEHENL